MGTGSGCGLLSYSRVDKTFWTRVKVTAQAASSDKFPSTCDRAVAVVVLGQER